jgi:uncharacterized protein YbjT (DUF2867 family)
VLLHHGHRVRALTRRPSSPPASILRAAGAEICEADLEDSAAVERAAEGADAFFLMATPYEAGAEAERRQACRAAKAAKNAGAKHLVYSSVASANQDIGVPRFDGKAKVEECISGLGVPYTIVGPVFFMENLVGRMFIRQMRTGTLLMSPLAPRGTLQMVAVEDVASFVRVVLERPGEFEGKRIDIASDTLTGPEIAAILAQVVGRDISYVEPSAGSVRARATEFARVPRWFDQVGHEAGIDALVRSRSYDAAIDALARSYPEVGWHDFQRWAREQNWGVLNGADPVPSSTP